jgi:hypothetical protein
VAEGEGRSLQPEAPLEGDLAEGVELGVGQFDLERGEIFPQVPE